MPDPSADVADPSTTIAAIATAVAPGQGSVAIVRWDGHYDLVPLDAVERIRERDAEAIVANPTAAVGSQVTGPNERLEPSAALRKTSAPQRPETSAPGAGPCHRGRHRHRHHRA